MGSQGSRASGARGARRCSAAFSSHYSPPGNFPHEKQSVVISREAVVSGGITGQRAPERLRFRREEKRHVSRCCWMRPGLFQPC